MIQDMKCNRLAQVNLAPFGVDPLVLFGGQPTGLREASVIEPSA